MSEQETQPDRLSVALLSPGWPIEAMANGIVSYIATLIGGMQRLGTRCHVLTARPIGDGLEPFVHVLRPDNHSLLSKLMWRIKPHQWGRRTYCDDVLREISSLCRGEGIDVLELEESYGWAQLLSRKSPVPLVVRLHGPWFLNGAANGVQRDAAFIRRDRWEREGLLAADAITSPSRHVLEQTRQHFGLEFPDAQIIANPVEPVDHHDRWNLMDCDRNRIAFVGRFDRHKGGDTMLDAFAQVVNQWPDARLDFIGPDRGLIDDAGGNWTIEDYLRSKLLESQRQKVTVHGFQPPSQAARMRRRALVTVVPSRYETFGIAAAEAMAAACPLVVTDAGALTELIQDGRNGLVVPAGDPGALAEKLLTLLGDAHRAAQLGEQAAADAVERYSPDIVARQTIDCYRRVLGRPAGVDRHKSSMPVVQDPASVSA